jgi:DNA-binding response OmpR family regulator
MALHSAGHNPIVIERPLSALTVAWKVRWDIACVDASVLGNEALSLFRGGNTASPVLGLGLEDGSLAACLALPLVAETFLANLQTALTSAPRPQDEAPDLRLDVQRRFALANGREIPLTRTEFRLLSYLFETQPREVPLTELLASVWGFTEDGRSASVLLRAHVRNLRLKLAQVGLGDAIRSRRGRGYVLVL